MKKTKRAFRATAASAVLAATLSQPAHAICVAGDLAGEWSMYTTIVGDLAGNAVVLMQKCALTLSNAGSAPVRYSIDGTCRAYSTGQTSTPITMTGDGTLTVTRNCTLRGGYTLQQEMSPDQTFTIVDARIEDQTSKRQINGIGRIDQGGGQFLVFHFNFTR